MADTLCQFFTWAIRDVIFFSGDVQTTTIAVAITSSLCCSIVVAVVHVVALILPAETKQRAGRKNVRTSSTSSHSGKKLHSDWLSNGQIQVPCVKCGEYFADTGCRFVTCKKCCFVVLSCQVHQKNSVSSRPCRTQHTQIDLSSVGLIQCPDRLGFVGSQLTCLSLADNQLTSLPPEIGCLRGLVRLSVKNNQLHTLPTTLSALSHLNVLDVSHNLMTEIPKCATSLFNLQELYMRHNLIQRIPPDIAALTQLNTLDLSHNSIDELIEAVFHILQLENLRLKSNPLENIPVSVGNLVILRCLDLQSCDLESIPVTIGNCTQLEKLKLANNRLRSLPAQVGQLGKLLELLLDNNKLKYLPATLSFLPEPVKITVQGNPVIEPEDYCSYSVDSDTCGFPSLQELTARYLTKHNIPYINMLPTLIQDMLRCPQLCSVCGGPLFEFCAERIEPWQFMCADIKSIPLLYQRCSPHLPQGCG